MKNISLKKDNSIHYDYLNEDTFYFVNYRNLAIFEILGSYLFAVFLIMYIIIPYTPGNLIMRSFFYITAMLLQVFTAFNYRFLIKRDLKEFTWISVLFTIIHCLFYLFLLTFIIIEGTNFINIMNTIFG